MLSVLSLDNSDCLLWKKKYIYIISMGLHSLGGLHRLNLMLKILSAHFKTCESIGGFKEEIFYSWKAEHPPLQNFLRHSWTPLCQGSSPAQPRPLVAPKPPGSPCRPPTEAEGVRWQPEARGPGVYSWLCPWLSGTRGKVISAPRASVQLLVCKTHRAGLRGLESLC